MMSGKAKRHALSALDASIEERQKILKKAKKKAMKGSPRGKQRCDLWLNEAPTGSMAHEPTRRAAAEFSIDLLLTHHAQAEGTERRCFLATFAWDEGVIPVDASQLPDPKPLQHKIYKALNEIGLSGITFMEMAVFVPDDAPPYFHVHFHVICWTYDPLFKPLLAADRLSERRAFHNAKFQAVDIRSRKMAANRFPDKSSHQYQYLFSNLNKDQTKPSIAWLGRYPWKAPTSVKMVRSKAEIDRDSIVNVVRSREASRLHVQLELFLRQLSVLDVVSGVNEGAALSRAWRSQMRTWLKGKDDAHDGSRGDRQISRSRKKRARGKRRRQAL